MRKLTAFVLCSATLIGMAWRTPSLAGQLEPAKAIAIRTSLVTAYLPCSDLNIGSPAFGGACTPPKPWTAANPANKTTFGPKGTLNLSLNVGKSDYAVVVKGKDIRNNGVPYTGDLRLVLKMRTTDVNCGYPFWINACTSNMDYELLPQSGGFLVVPCKAGQCTLKTTANTLRPGLIAMGNNSGIEVRDIAVLDPDGDFAFRPGLIVP